MYFALANDVNVAMLGGNFKVRTFSRPNNEWSVIVLFIWICRPTWEYLQKFNTANSRNLPFCKRSLPPLNRKQSGTPEILVELSKSIEVTNPDVTFS